ncbi:MAG: MlaD family protein [Nannocystaceae bacterium]|nr:hypothetical protein [bacterium]
MGSRKRRGNVTRGLITVVLFGASFALLFLAPRARSLTQERVAVYADFRTIASLRPGSIVQLAGVNVGAVEGVNFVQVKYRCDPLSEDIGRYGQGRTDSCDQDLFCAPTGYCADLESYAGKGHHTRCDATADCAHDEICFTGAVRSREAHLDWGGPRGVCARFNTDHTRTRVRMKVPMDIVPLLRGDSRAVIASNGVLEAPKVNISAGRGDELCPLVREDLESYSYDECLANMRVQARPSLTEDIDRMRKRVESFMAKADTSIVAVMGLIDQLQSEETMDALKGTVHNLGVITHTLAYGDGLVPALMHSQQYRKDIGGTLGALHRTSFGLQRTAAHGNDILDTLDRNMGPLLGDTEATFESVDGLLADLDDPKNKSLTSKLLRDDTGDIARDLELIFDHGADVSSDLASITEAVDTGKGTLGLLATDDRVANELGKLLDSLAKHDTLRALTLWYLEKRLGAISVSDTRSSARP